VNYTRTLLTNLTCLIATSDHCQKYIIMTWENHFNQSQRTYYLICLITLVSFALLFHAQYTNQLPNNNTEYKPITESIKDDNVTSIDFFESEIAEPNSFPPKAVFVVRAKGYGLGNHLFAYAEAYALSRRLRLPLVIPSAPTDQEENALNFTHREYVLDQFKFPKGIYATPEEIGSKNDVHGLSCQMGKDPSLIPSNVTNITNYYKIGGFC